jgi:hypothetical protein
MVLTVPVHLHLAQELQLLHLPLQLLHLPLELLLTQSLQARLPQAAQLNELRCCRDHHHHLMKLALLLLLRRCCAMTAAVLH